MVKKILIFGHGYVSRFLGRQLLEEGWLVYATSRSVCDRSDDAGITVLSFFSDELPALIEKADLILSTVAPGDDDPVLSRYQGALTQSCARWVAYVSATSVYGDYHGEWVDEVSECRPADARSKRRYRVEQTWLGLHKEYGLPVHAFRLSGIYGPNRNALERLKQSGPPCIVKAGHTFSRIHVLDICQALKASMERPTPGEVFNVSDDEPAALHEVQAYAADLLGVRLQTVSYEQADLTPGMRSFFEANKKINATKIKECLGVTWLYSSYREGLDALFLEQGDRS